MTGNKIAWRAPLAGLASLAMVATMGVAAGTANAAGTSYKVTFDGGKTSTTIDVAKGLSAADALYQVSGSKKALSAADDVIDGSQKFVGWTKGGEAYDLFAPVTDNVTLEASYDANAVPVHVDYQKAGAFKYIAPSGSTTSSYGWGVDFYASANSTLTASQLPQDVASDGYLVNDWTVNQKPSDTANSIVNDVKDLKGLQIAGSPVKVEITADTLSSNVKTVKFERGSFTNGNLAGDMLSDSTARKVDGLVGVDVDASAESAKAPAWTQDEQESSVKTPVNWKNTATSKKSADLSSVALDGTNYEFVLDESTAKETAVVTFKDDLNNTVEYRYVTVTTNKDGQKVGHVTDAPDNPTYKDQVFKGWKDASGKVVSKQNLDGTMSFADYNVTKNVTLTAQWAKTSLVNVIFRDQNYAGSNEDVVVPTAAGDFVDSSKVPAWTRDGYTLSWFVDLNGDAVKDTNEPMFDALTMQINTTVNGVAIPGNNFIVRALWAKATVDQAKTALNYVTVGIKDASVFGANAPSDASYFTKESFAEFTKVEQAQYQTYKKYVYQAENSQIAADKSAEIVNNLAAAWKKLVFKHDAGSDPAFSEANTVLHRLYNASVDDHFYTANKAELLLLTAPATNGAWKDEGVLAQAAPTKFADYTAAAKAAAVPAANIDAVDQALSKVAAPIVTSYIRFYNPSNGDHVWTAEGGEEYATLKPQASWNEEGVAFAVPTYTGSRDVTRQYQPAKSRHLLSTDPAEQKLNESRGWTTEGVAFKAV